jgi:tRNA pseudouridine65 synthase
MQQMTPQKTPDMTPDMTQHGAGDAAAGGPPADGRGLPAAHPPLRLIHRDAQLLAVHKPAGLLVHRSALDAHAQTDVVTQLREQTGAPVWPVHRLDKGTSGVLLLARDLASARALGAAFAAGSSAPGSARPAPQETGPIPATPMQAAVQKRYLALVRGWPDAAGEIDQALARDPELPSTGQPQLAAITRWRVLQRLTLPLASDPRHPDTRLALLEVQPLTGRRHQIRRHLKALAHPLIGDATHGKGPLNRAIAAHLGHTRLWLHALTLLVPRPASGLPLALRAEPGPEWDWLDWPQDQTRTAPP